MSAVSTSEGSNSPTGPDAVRERLLETRDLKVHFRVVTGGRGLRRRLSTIRALDGVNLAVNKGESLAVVGESGSGKTTLGRVICRLQRPTGGEILFKGRPLGQLEGQALTAYRKAVQMVFQDPYASLDPRLTTGPIVTEPLEVNRMGSRVERRAAALRLLELVGLRPDFVGRYPYELSGGQRQRVAIARSLAPQPELVVADEPTSALDVSAQAQILNLIRELQHGLGLAVVYITHNLPTVRYVADRVIVMYLGQVIEVGAAPQVLAEAAHPYTRSLLTAAPTVETAASRETRFLIPGEPPDPAAPPSGCRFHTRCWWRRELGDPPACEQVEPSAPTADDLASAACHFSAEMLEALRAGDVGGASSAGRAGDARDAAEAGRGEVES